MKAHHDSTRNLHTKDLEKKRKIGAVSKIYKRGRKNRQIGSILDEPSNEPNPVNQIGKLCIIMEQFLECNKSLYID